MNVAYYLADIREVGEEIEVGREVLADRLMPVVTAVGVASLRLPGMRIEVDIVAVRQDG